MVVGVVVEVEVARRLRALGLCLLLGSGLDLIWLG
jgi:hypothetical protein